MEELKNIHYDAFISYRHCESDSFVAEKIHRKLESFKLPKSVLPKVKNGKKRIERVFRDVEELPLSDNLSDPITNALNNSDFLITICSPRYLESKWCMKEVELFLQNHDKEHILVVLADGEPADSFPKILTYEEIVGKDENGNTVITRLEKEPLAADTRGENRKEILKAIDIAIIKLCAVIFELNYDDLRQRHRRQKMRRMTAIFGSIGAALLIFAVISSLMLIKISKQKETISEQYSELEDRYASSMAAVSEKLMGEGRRKDAAYALRSVLPDDETNGYNSDALRSLYSVMDIGDISGKYVPEIIYEMESEIIEYSISADNKYILINDDYNVTVFERVSGRIVKTIEKTYDPEGNYFVAAFCGTSGIIVNNAQELKYYSLDGNEIKDLDHTDSSPLLFSSPEGNVTLMYFDRSGILEGFNNNGDLLYTIDVNDFFDASYSDYADIDFDNGRVAISFLTEEGYEILVFDGISGEIIASRKDYDAMTCVVLIDGDTLYYSVLSDNDYTTRSINHVIAYDLINACDLWSRSFYEMTSTDLAICEEGLFMSQEDMILELTLDKGDVLNYYYLENPLIHGWIENDQYNYINYNGAIYFCNMYRIYEDTEYFFSVKPFERVLSAQYQNGELFVLNNASNYLICYSLNRDSDIIATDYDYEYGFHNNEEDIVPPEEAGLNNYRKVIESRYSNDKKYIVALYSDYTIKIYDAVTMEEINTFESVFTDYTDFRFFNNTGTYVLSGRYYSLILNDRFEIICQTDRILDEQDGKFIIRNMDGISYLVPFTDYKSLIKKTDEYLSGYKPDESIKRKYNLN